MIMPERKPMAARVEMNTLTLAIVVLLGVLIMASGFYLNDSMITYLGILVTCAASWATLVFTMVKAINNRQST